MSQAEALAARMHALRGRFLERAARDHDAIGAAWAAGDRAALAALCHSLAGNAGMFGFAAIGDQARALEQAAGEAPDLAAHEADTHALLAALREAADAG